MVQSSSGTPGENKSFLVLWMLAGALLVVAWLVSDNAPSSPSKLVQCRPAFEGSQTADFAPPYEERVIYQSQSRVAHSPTLAQHKDGSIQAIWFAGDDEADPQTGLVEARLVDGVWSKPKKLLTAQSDSLERGLSIHTIGNPLLFVDPEGTALLYYVTPSLGGWATSRISVRTSGDFGQNWGEATILRTSPFFNMSTLVRQNPVCLDDGGLALPIHFELIFDYPVLAQLDPDMNVTGLRRMYRTWGEGLQPLVLPINGEDVVALIRPTKSMERRVYQAISNNGGQSWSDPEAMDLPNPRAPVCGVNLGDENALISFNDSENGRKNLRLAYRAGKNGSWQKLNHEFNASSDISKLAYCSMMVDTNGRVHMVFSDRYKGEIHYASFSAKWLKAKLP